MSANKTKMNTLYFLSVIDCFSKYAWTFPLKNKKPEGIVEAFKQIFKETGRKPEILQVDEGLEFKGKFKKYCEDECRGIYMLKIVYKGKFLKLIPMPW